jgi:hypothetical protein
MKSAVARAAGLPPAPVGRRAVAAEYEPWPDKPWPVLSWEPGGSLT